MTADASSSGRPIGRLLAGPVHDNSELLTEQALELRDKAGAADGWAFEVVLRGLIDDVKAALLARELTPAELDV